MKYSLIILFSFFIFSCDNDSENNSPVITPADYVEKVNKLALKKNINYKLIEIYSGGPILRGPIDTNGLLYNSPFHNSWSFVFVRKNDILISSRQIVCSINGRIDICDELSIPNPDLFDNYDNDSIFIPLSGWLNVVSVISTALNNGGRNFLLTYLHSIIYSKLTSFYSPFQKRLIWVFNFTDQFSEIYTIYIDAKTGELLNMPSSLTAHNKRVAVHSCRKIFL